MSHYVGSEGTMAKREHVAVNVADAKKQFSELLGRVAYGGETVLITRRGKPMAKLVPLEAAEGPPHLADVKGWLADDDPLFESIDAIVAARHRHRPRILSRRRGRS